MINWEKSAQLNDMTADELKVWFEKYPSSNKRIIRICDECLGKHEMRFADYSLLCNSCAHKTNEYRKLQTKNTTKQFSTQEARDDQADRRKQFHIDNPDAGNEHGKRMIQYYIDNPEARETARLKSLEQWSDPEACAEMSEIKKQFYIDNPGMHDQMSDSMNKYLFDHPEYADRMRGGNDLVWHHVAYDFGRPDVLRVRITRKFHSSIHHPKGCSFSERGYSLID